MTAPSRASSFRPKEHSCNFSSETKPLVSIKRSETLNSSGCQNMTPSPLSKNDRSLRRDAIGTRNYRGNFSSFISSNKQDYHFSYAATTAKTSNQSFQRKAAALGIEAEIDAGKQIKHAALCSMHQPLL